MSDIEEIEQLVRDRFDMSLDEFVAALRTVPWPKPPTAQHETSV